MARIVVVEDAPDSLRLFRAVLRRAGHEVFESPDGKGLPELVRLVEPDLVLLDIELPERDGFALLADLREADLDPVVVALTAHAGDQARARAVAAGFDGFITKPIDVRRFPDEVTGFLRSAADRARKDPGSAPSTLDQELNRRR